MVRSLFPPFSDVADAGVSRLLYVHSLIAAGKLRSNPLWRQEGGLAKLDEGLNLIKEGKVRSLFVWVEEDRR